MRSPLRHPAHPLDVTPAPRASRSAFLVSMSHAAGCIERGGEYDLRPLLVAGADDDAIRQFLADATWTKQAGHGIATSAFERPDRTMSAIGG